MRERRAWQIGVLWVGRRSRGGRRGGGSPLEGDLHLPERGRCFPRGASAGAVNLFLFFDPQPVVFIFLSGAVELVEEERFDCDEAAGTA